MITSRFIGFDDARPVLTNPEIFQRISEDGATIDNLIQGPNEIFIGTFLDGQLIAVWWLWAMSSTTLDIHTHVLPGYREYSIQSWLQCLGLIESDLPSIHKLQAKVPQCFPEVYHFAKNRGMRDEGMERESHFKNGRYWNQWLIGATVAEMKNG